ncbi:hypothetical protein [Geothrix oryzisoli]|uniref:hypothetical protein n=1 Tax=Geothrix oryzisoli TaxID=2922721 RepID=UPI001FACD323|nr:hypothetical protein [Geothrix oryzisoli]
MKRAEAEKLLGGHATGNLTAEERRRLFEAALASQDLFDALADEEALRELLADPAARTQVLAALAAPAGPKVVPFWRRPGLIGAAAGLIVATTAGLAILRSPEAPLPAAKVEAAPAPAAAPAAEAKPGPAPAAKTARFREAAEPRQAQTAPASGNLAAPAPTPVPSSAPPPAPVQAAGAVAPSEAARRQLEVRDQVARKEVSVGQRRAAAVAEVLGSVSTAPGLAVTAAPAGGPPASLTVAPVWTLDPLPDGSTRVTVRSAPTPHVVLLRRGEAGVEVLVPAPTGGSGPWRFQVRLAPGDALDLYVMNDPVTDAAKLPETGPVKGFRARIQPPAKKDPPR